MPNHLAIAEQMIAYYDVPDADSVVALQSGAMVILGALDIVIGECDR